MEKDKNQERLFSEFPPVSTEQWEERIQQDLKGADYEKKLVWKTAEGFKIKPYYRAEDLSNLNEMLSSNPGEFPFIRGTEGLNNQWVICQDIESADPIKANKAALTALERGAQAVLLNVSEVSTIVHLEKLLNGFDLTKVYLLFNSAPNYTRFAELIKQYADSNKIDFTLFNIIFDFDPISYILLNGNFYNSQEEDLKQGIELLHQFQGISKSRVISVNGQYFHNAGSTLVQELAFALAAGNEYLSWYTSRGLNADEVASRMIFVFATGGNYFMEIAKLRAARFLWAQIVKQYNPGSESASKMFVHSMTANWNKSIYDPYVNLLRTTTEAMSAAIGHADIITVLPFDMNYQEPDDFSLRIARNQQIILKEESNLDKVIDPAAGSYYVENLTAAIVDSAWKLFLKVEEMGGMLEAVKQGFVQDEINASAKQKKDDAANRRTLILGTNQHPNLHERMLDKIQAEEEDGNPDDNELLDQISVPYTRKPEYKKIEIMRAADEFEDLRLATEIWENEGNKRPDVFMLTIGNPAMRKARAAFSTGFFGCAGYNIIDNTGFANIEDGLNAAINSKAEIITLCSSDEEYAEFGESIAQVIKKSLPDSILVVAGYPKDNIEALKVSGVDEFIHIKSNAIQTLYDIQKKLGIML